MENEALYPELRNYIFENCGKYFWRKQRVGILNLPSTLMESDSINILMYKLKNRPSTISANETIKDLLNLEFEAYKEKITTLIFNDHKDELELNLCPKCNKIARTPYTKQCRYCFHSWHEKLSKGNES